MGKRNWVTMDVAAKRLGVDRSTVIRWEQTGKIDVAPQVACHLEDGSWYQGRAFTEAALLKIEAWRSGAMPSGLGFDGPVL